MKDEGQNEMAVTCREGGIPDCALLGRMNHQLIRDEAHRNPMTEEELAGRMRGWIAGGAYRALIFEREGVPSAYALFRVEPDASIYLRHFFVARECRREGIGAAAIRMLFRDVFPPGARVTVEVLAHNAAGREFWQAAGFSAYSLSLERQA
jgi:GNAT superfamily N-acetyltransferase